jgi:RNA polymerase sigma factor (sigma-70 family)
VHASEPGAPDALFHEHHPALLRYLRRLSGDPDTAEDAAQEAFFQLLRSPPEPTHLRAWLFRVATRALRTPARTAARRLHLLRGSPDRAPVGDAPPQPDAALDAAERRRIVRAALDALPPRQKTALLMREEGFSHREIAGALGTTTGSVGTLIARALQRLGSELELYGEEGE